MIRISQQAGIRADHVWIADELLDAALRSFFHSPACRRKASFVPGPMEARKRAARRRMANIAPSALYGGAGVDPGFLSGLKKTQGTPEWRWEGPRQPIPPKSAGISILCTLSMAETNQHPAADILPRWLWTPPPRPLDIPKPKEPPIASTSKPSKATRHATQVMERFKQCKSLPSLRKFATEEGIDLKSYSRLAFHQLLVSNQPITVLLGFLSDPTLNDKKAQNLKFFLEWQLNHSTRENEAQTLVTDLTHWTKYMQSVNRITGEDLLHMVRFFRRTAKLVRDDILNVKFAEVLMDVTSNIQGLRDDVKYSILGDLFEILLLGPSSQPRQQLGVRIIRTLPEIVIQQMEESIAKFTIRTLSLIDSSSAANTKEALEQATSPLFRCLPEKTLHAVICMVSKRLLQKGSNYHQSILQDGTFLDLWFGHLKRHDLFSALSIDDPASGMLFLLRDRDVPTIAAFLRHLTDEQNAIFILQSWCSGQAETVQDLRERLQERPSLFAYSQVLIVLKESGLLSLELFPKLFRLLKAMDRSDVILQILRDVNVHWVEIPISAVVQCARDHNDDYGRLIFQSDPRISPEDYPEFAIDLIQNTSISPNFLWLTANDTRRVSPLACGNRWKRARSNFYGKLAISFAQAQQHSSRVMFRFVYRCYTLHRMERLGPLNEELVKALVHVCVTLRMQRMEWISTVMLRWLLHIVKVTEGEESALVIDQIVYDWRSRCTEYRQSRLYPDKMTKAVHEPSGETLHQKYADRLAELEDDLHGPRGLYSEADTLQTGADVHSEDLRCNDPVE